MPAPTQTIVITGSASGGGLRAFDAPYAVGVVGSDTLRAAGPMVNLSEALSRLPGLVAANRNNYAQDLQISSRGFGARASFGVRGLRLVSDGIPASGPDGQGQVSHFDIAGAERVEVLRGPFSALYGNSSGGVIALVSAAPQARALTLGVDAGSDGLQQWRLGIEAPLAGGFSLRAQVSRFETDGVRPQSSTERRLGNLRLGWDGERDRVVVVLNSVNQPALDPLGLTRAQFDADPGQTTGVALPQQRPGQGFRYNTRKNTWQDQAGASWRHRFEHAGALQASQLVAYSGQRSVTQWQSIPDAAQAPATQPGGVIDFDRRYRGVDGRLIWRWALAGERSAQLVAGASVDRSSEDRRGFRNYTGDGAARVLGVTGELRRDERNRVSTRDFYAQAQAEIARRWTATLGLRRGGVDFTSSDRYIAGTNGDDSGRLGYRYTNPVAALQWRGSPELNVYLSVARGFESPTFGELAYRPDGQPGFNGALKAQTSRQLELGAKWRPAGLGLRLDAAVFDARSDDEIGVATSSGGRTTFRNVGRTQRRGAELETRWQPAAAWRVHLAATWLDATYRDGLPAPAGRRIAGTLRAFGYAELAWQALPALELALEARGQGRLPVNDTNSDFAAGHGLLGLRALWRQPVGAGRLELLGRADNLADRRVVGSVIVNEGNQRFFEPAAGRTLLVSARWVQPF
ncbi:MAG: TonB-dependent receptor [Leptothrix sp. (in: Bacteria)]|nr:TonB-dependent receptor [Leptothrix sp. (in: b-proteobacteria)]